MYEPEHDSYVNSTVWILEDRCLVTSQNTCNDYKFKGQQC